MHFLKASNSLASIDPFGAPLTLTIRIASFAPFKAENGNEFLNWQVASSEKDFSAENRFQAQEMRKHFWFNFIDCQHRWLILHFGIFKYLLILLNDRLIKEKN